MKLRLARIRREKGCGGFMKRRKRLQFALLVVFAGAVVTVPAFANPPFPNKCAPINIYFNTCGTPGAATHQAANDFEPTYYLFGQSGFGGFGKLYIPPNGDQQGVSDPAPTLSRISQPPGTLTVGSYSYKVAAFTGPDRTGLHSAAGGSTISINSTQWNSGLKSIRVSWNESTGAASYGVYGRQAGSEQLLATVNAVSGQTSYRFTDTGLTPPSGDAPPTFNETLPRLARSSNFALPDTERDSYVEANCISPAAGYRFRARVVLTGLPINNPAGLINATAPATRTQLAGNFAAPYGTLGDPRFSIRWFPSIGGAPTASPPTGYDPNATFSSPAPAEIGTASISGTNNPPQAAPGQTQDQSKYCNFRENLFVEGRATLEVKTVVAPNTDAGKFNLIVKDTSGATLRSRPDAGNNGSTNDDCNNPPTQDGPLCYPPNRTAGPCEPGGPACGDQNVNGDNWPRIAPTSYLVSETAGTGTLLSNYTSQISCNDKPTGDHLASGAGPETITLPAGANVHVVCTITNTRN
jgi:prealbumin domain-containing protein